MELLHSRPRGTAVGSRISSGTLPATLTSAFARCALRFVRWNAPQWSHGMFIALTQSCISWWNGRDSLQLGCRTLQRTCPELLGRSCVATGAEPRCCRRPCVARRLGPRSHWHCSRDRHVVYGLQRLTDSQPSRPYTFTLPLLTFDPLTLALQVVELWNSKL